jgi:hypothetical protein
MCAEFQQQHGVKIMTGSSGKVKEISLGDGFCEVAVKVNGATIAVASGEGCQDVN